MRIIIEGRLRLENLSKKLKEKTFGCPATKIEGKKIKGKLKVFLTAVRQLSIKGKLKKEKKKKLKKKKFERKYFWLQCDN